MKLSLKSVPQQRYQRNIFVLKEVASLYEDVRRIPDIVLRGVAHDVLTEIIRLKGDHQQDTLKILEVGMGTGRFFKHLANEAVNMSRLCLYGVDSSKAALQKAKESIPSLAGTHYNLLHNVCGPLPYPADFFDASISFYAYHCIVQWQLALRNILHVTSNPKIIVFLREESQWGFHLDNKFAEVTIDDELYYQFWEKYFSARKDLAPLPKREISASNLDKLFDYLKSQGFRHFPTLSQHKWRRQVDFNDALLSIEKGLFTKTRVGLTPQHRSHLRARMEDWLNKTVDDWGMYSGSMNATIGIDYFIKD